MKKFGILFFILLIVCSFSCQKNTKKNVDTAKNKTSDDDVITDTDDDTDSSDISCSNIEILSGTGDCTDTTCDFTKALSLYTIKVFLSGVTGNSVKVELKEHTSDMKISNTSNSSYFTLSGRSPARGNTRSATVQIKDSDNEGTCTIDITTDSLSTSSSDSSSDTLDDTWSKVCNTSGDYSARVQAWCEWIRSLKN